MIAPGKNSLVGLYRRLVVPLAAIGVAKIDECADNLPGVRVGVDGLLKTLDGIVKLIESEVDADFELLQIALDELLTDSPRQHAVVMHRFFGGLTIRATSEMLNVSVQTVERDWRLARAKLYQRLRGDGSSHFELND